MSKLYNVLNKLADMSLENESDVSTALSRSSANASLISGLEASKADKAETLAALSAKADLVGGKVPDSQLPSYIDEAVEYDSYDDFPASGSSDTVYVALDTGYSYRWSGTTYTQIHAGGTAGDVVFTDGVSYASGTVGGAINNQSSRIATKAEKTALASTDREVALIRKAIEGQLMEVEEDHTEAYSKILPSGTIGVGVNMIGGKSVVKNQIVSNNTDDSTYKGITFHKNSNGSWTITGTPTEPTNNFFNNVRYNENSYFFEEGHKYIVRGTVPGKVSIFVFRGGTSNGHDYDFIYTAIAKTGIYDLIRIRLVDGLTSAINETVFPEVIDITTWFNGDSTKLAAITTPEDAYALGVPRGYIPYNAGEIISADCEGAVSEGFNIWDEQWEVGGINDTTGAKEPVSSQFRIKNYIKVNPSTAYYFYSGTGYLWAYSYDINKNFIGRLVGSENNIANTIRTTQSRCEYILFKSRNEDNVLQYYNNICINVSQPDTTKNPHNGQYLPYMHDAFSIPQGLRTAHPLRSVGTVHDEYDFERMKFVQRVNSVDLGDLTWVAYNTSTYPALWYTNIDDRVDGIECKCLPEIIEYEFYAYTARSSWIGIRDNDKSVCKAAVDASYPKRLWINDSNFVGKTSAQVAEIVAGKILIYEKETPTETDISSYFPEGFSPLLNAEAGGSLTFAQTDTEFPLPNSTDYFVKTTPTVA